MKKEKHEATAESKAGGRPKTGTVRKTRAGLWQGVVTLADGSRMRLEPFPKGTSEAMAREKTAYWAEQFASRRNPKTQAKAAHTPASSAQSWFDAWLADKAARGQPSVRDKRAHWDHHIAPVLEKKHPSKWQPEDLRALVAGLDENIRAGVYSWKTARNIWGTVTTMCAEAVTSKINELRCREDNPAASVKGPDRGVEKDKEFLYPSEFQKLMECGAAPMRMRRLFALSVFTGLRRGEIQALEWEDVNLTEGLILVHRSKGRDGAIKSTKGKRSRKVPIHENVAPLLHELWKETNGTGRVLADTPYENEFSLQLRDWLLKAGCERRSLHETTATTRQLTFHDLRGTYATWLSLDGVEVMTIKQRMGHSNVSTTEGYVRAADAVRHIAGKPFPPLPATMYQGVSCAGFVTTGRKSAVFGSKMASPAGFEFSSSPHQHEERPLKLAC